VFLNKARRTGDRKQAANLLEQSVLADLKAVEKATDGLARFSCLLDLGTSYTEWANYVDPRVRSRQDLLNEAIQAVRRAQQIDQESYGELAATRLGNAYEDLAWLAKVSIGENYDLAIDAFSTAIEKRSDQAGRWFDRGRCYFKREADSRQTGKGYMDKAFDDLSRAVDLDKTEVNAPIRYWLGKVWLYRAGLSKDPRAATARFVEAEKLFAKASELAKSQRLPEAPSYSVAWAAARLKDKSFPAAQIRAQLAVLLRAAESDAPGNKDYRNQLYVAQAKSYEREGDAHDEKARALNGDASLASKRLRDANWSDALKTYDTALGPDLAKNDILDVGLLKARIRLRLEMPRNSAMYEELVRDADRVVELMGPEADSEAYYLAARPRGPLAITLGSTSPEVKARASKLYKESADFLDKAIAAASEQELNYTLLRDHAVAIKLMINNDHALAAKYKPKAQRSMERALQIAEPQARGDLGRIKREIDAL